MVFVLPTPNEKSMFYYRKMEAFLPPGFLGGGTEKIQNMQTDTDLSKIQEILKHMWLPKFGLGLTAFSVSLTESSSKIKYLDH